MDLEKLTILGRRPVRNVSRVIQQQAVFFSRSVAREIVKVASGRIAVIMRIRAISDQRSGSVGDFAQVLGGNRTWNGATVRFHLSSSQDFAHGQKTWVWDTGILRFRVFDEFWLCNCQW